MQSFLVKNLVTPLYGVAAALDTHKILYLGQLPFEVRAGHITGARKLVHLTIRTFVIHYQVINIYSIDIEPVVTHLIHGIQEDEHTTSKAHAKAYNVDQRKTFVPPKVSECGFEVVSYHGFS